MVQIQDSSRIQPAFSDLCNRFAESIIDFKCYQDKYGLNSVQVLFHTKIDEFEFIKFLNHILNPKVEPKDEPVEHKVEPKDEPSAEQYELVEPKDEPVEHKVEPKDEPVEHKEEMAMATRITTMGRRNEYEKKKGDGGEDHHNGKKKMAMEAGFPNSHAKFSCCLPDRSCCAVDDLDDCYLTTDDVVDQLKLVE